MIETRVGLRPLSADGLPVLGRVPGVAGAYVATGHGPSGLTLGPYSARVVADLVVGHVSDLDLAPFRADRFHAAAR
jgi:D-amino-acid dehydrogenase